MAYFTEGSNSTKVANRARLLLSSSMAVFFATLNIALFSTASVGNVLIFVALRSVSSILPSKKLLFKNLTATDYTVGLIAKPILAIYIVLDAVAKMNSNILASVLKVQIVFTFTLCGVSIITPAIVRIDRLFALRLGIRYRHVVTLKRVRVVTGCIMTK